MVCQVPTSTIQARDIPPMNRVVGRLYLYLPLLDQLAYRHFMSFRAQFSWWASTIFHLLP